MTQDDLTMGLMMQSGASDATDSVSGIQADILALKGMSAQDAIEFLARQLVEFTFHLAIAIGIFYIGRFIINRLYRIVLRTLRRRNVEASLSTFLLSMVRIVLYFILIVTVIGIIGINTSSFLALFASAGVAIGMALSGTLQNFAGGVLILLLKPYRIGDYIEAQGYAGTVREIQIFHTLILTPDNKSIIIPNGGLSTGSINNYSREPLRRVTWSISLAYGDDFAKAKEAILEMLLADNRVIRDVYKDELHAMPLLSEGDLPDRSPSVFLDQMADSAIVLTVRAWVKSSDYWTVYYGFNEIFYRELPLRGFNFPFPQLDVHMIS